MHSRRAWERTVKPSCLVEVAHLVVPEREVVEALASPEGLFPVYLYAHVRRSAPNAPHDCAGDEHTLQQAHALHLMLADRALHQAPRIVELRLDSDMAQSQLLLVLEAEDLYGDCMSVR